MNQVAVGAYDSSEITHDNADGMHRLRYRVFKEQLGWDVPTENDREKDQYDTANSVYFIVQNSNLVEGCMRAVPTSKPYMLDDIFPELLRGEEAPHDTNVWELSRMATISQITSPANAAKKQHDVFVDIVVASYDFAVLNGVKAYIAVATAAHERLYRRLGLPVRRFGDSRTTTLGEGKAKVRAVAFWIDINEQFEKAVVELRGLSRERKVV